MFSCIYLGFKSYCVSKQTEQTPMKSIVFGISYGLQNFKKYPCRCFKCIKGYSRMGIRYAKLFEAAKSMFKS